MKLASSRDNEKTPRPPVRGRRRERERQEPEREALIDEQVRRVVGHLAALGYCPPPEPGWASDTCQSPDSEADPDDVAESLDSQPLTIDPPREESEPPMSLPAGVQPWEMSWESDTDIWPWFSSSSSATPGPGLNL